MSLPAKQTPFPEGRRHEPVSTRLSEDAVKLEVMVGEGELARLMRAFDWSQTPLGPVADWPHSLRTVVNLILSSQHPMWLGWGPEVTFLYNDAYIQVLSRAKHPWALGRPAAEVWAEIWDVCGPLAEKVFEQGEPTFLDDVRLFMNRGDYLEETYYSFSYSPVRDESGRISGLFCPSAEVTSKVLNARRLRTLSELSATAFIEKSVENACASVMHTLAKNYDDVPFALLYMLSSEDDGMRLQGHTGFAGRVPPEPHAFVRSAFASADEPARSLADLLTQDPPPVIPVRHLNSIQLGPAQQTVKEAVVLPVRSRAEERTIGVLIAGVNPTRKLDAEYRTFYELVASHVATAIANARAYQSERRRVEAFAELDRAKTTFFSNISHEFRTPLTLMLGPIEAWLSRPARSGEDREDLELLHRNALRLLKLVNALLDFSRIEAGRVRAHFEPADLGAITAELASVFRSAADRAGLQLRVEAAPLSHPVYIDREMWEKIVLNLLSNAFKSTFEGEITVRVRQAGDHAEVSIADTGTGIPPSELPHLFERFRRVEGARRRTNEGSGIGLALVSELVTMHGGKIEVRSELGVGTTFTLALPFGDDHLPADQIVRTARGAPLPSAATAYVQEALSWLPGEQADPGVDLTDLLPVPEATQTSAQGKVLLVDDNRDMREYVRRLLAQKFDVTTADNGKTGLQLALAQPFDLVLTDVMMPEMDGFQLLTALRRDPRTNTLPVILLSARAGEESRVEGLDAGADDYLVKPFTARELMARVDSHIRMAEFRRSVQQQEAGLLAALQQAQHLVAEAVEHISDGFWTYDPDGRVTYLNPAAEAMSARPREEQIGRTLNEIYPDVEGTELDRQFVRALRDRQIVEFEWFYEPWQRWYRHRIYPTPDGGIAVYVRDSTETRLTEQALRRAEQLAAAGKLAASISHEINNPLEAVTNLLYLARIAPELTPETLSRLDVADKELQRLSHIARTSLKFYRQSSSPSNASLKDLLESVLMVFQARITHNNVKVVAEFAKTPDLYCFPSEIQQVFTNLVANSLDAFDAPGRLIFRVREAKGGPGRRKRGVRVTVADTGCGMNAVTKARAFEPFFTTKNDTGTGLGLWVSKGIVEKHGGTMHVSSKVGHGTVISLFFPFDGVPVNQTNPR